MITGVAFESGRAVIRCKYYGPTNTRGSRIRVSRFDPPAAGSDPNRVSVGWDHSLGLVPNYVAAVQAYLDRAGWSGSWAVSTVTDGAVAVYVPGSDDGVRARIESGSGAGWDCGECLQVQPASADYVDDPRGFRVCDSCVTRLLGGES